jgi:predicted nucleic acid-binding protein
LILLDTNVLSELVKPRPDPRVVTWTRHSAAALAMPATAAANDCALATRNVEDFTATGLQLINPWQDRG